MNVLVITSFLKNMMPYLGKYERILKEENISYDIVLWDREKNKETEKKENEYIIYSKCKLGGNKIFKIYSYWKYRKEILKILKNKKYDKIIIFNTLPAIAICDVLIKKYNKNYLFDYRDYTYEKYSCYRYLVNYIIKNSFYTMISSKGFFFFLKKERNIVLMHNISNIEQCEEFVTLKNRSKKIKIGYVGLIRYERENKNLIKNIKNSSRYILKYVGKIYSNCHIQKYCENNMINNVYFKGEYNNNEKNKIYKDIDMINAVYGNDSYEVRTALPNRLYDCLIFKKPIIVSENTYLANLVKKNKIGIAIDLNKGKTHVIEKLDKYVESFNEKDFLNKCNMLLSKIVEDEDLAKNKIKEFF